MFLHRPARSPDLIRRFVDQHDVETAISEFKSEWWKNERTDAARVTSFAKEEASKDIAALANAGGGDIFVGIVEDRRTGRAARFSDDPGLPRDPAKELHDWMEASVVPTSVTNTVEVEVVQLADSTGTQRTVCVVSVPPWPHGPVAVRRAEGEGFYFPFRDGGHTRFMELDEMFARAEAARRASYIKLKQVQGLHGSEAVITSPLEVTFWPDPEIPIPPGERDGRIVEVTEAFLRLEMYAGERAHQAALVVEARRRLGRHVAATRPGALSTLRVDEYPQSVWDEAEATVQDRISRNYNPMLVVPLSLLQDVWIAGGPPRIHLLLRCTVRLAGGRWTVATSGFR